MNASITNTIRVSARDNPFAVQRADAIPFDFSETRFPNIESFYQHAKLHNFRGAIRGKHGRGKTTLLCDLHSFLCQNGIRSKLVFLPRERHLRPATIESTIQQGGSGDIILIDGLERIPFFARQQLLSSSKSFGGFIATTHWPGRLRSLVHCKTSLHTLETVLHSLELNQPGIIAAAIPLFAKHKGNMRFVLRELYDLFAMGRIG